MADSDRTTMEEALSVLVIVVALALTWCASAVRYAWDALRGSR